MFWCPRQCLHVLPVIAQQARFSTASSSFDLAALPCRVVILKMADGRQHVLLRDSNRDLQLVVEGAGAFQPVQLHVDAIWPSKCLRHRMNGLECLNTLCTTGHLPERLFPPEARGSRLRLVLQALDGSLAGASQREIATALVGRQRVQADWTDPGDHLRDRVRRAIRRGRVLMNCSYQDFLA